MKPATVLFVASTLLLIGFSFSASANSGPPSSQISEDGVWQPELVRSEIELEAWLTDEPQDSPLNSLDRSSREIFLRSLRFSDRGLASFNYAALSDLKPSQLSRLFALFGLSTTLDSVLASRQDDATGQPRPSPQLDGVRRQEDYHGYLCSSRANCTKATFDNICIGANC